MVQDFMALDPNAWAARLAERLDPTPSPYADDPVGWCKETLGEFTTIDQQSIMRSVVDNRYTAVQSCHEVGKSFSASRLVAWWLDSHPPGTAFVVTTAPTAEQVGTVLWREIGQAHRKGELFGYVTGDNKWKIDHGGSSPEVVAIGRKPADHQAANFQGYHALYMLVVIDEACGVTEALYDAIDSLAANEYARVLAIGNPDDPSSHFAVVCKPGSGWNVIQIDGLKTPNMTREALKDFPLLRAYMIEQGIGPNTEDVPDTLRPLLVSAMWIEERLRRWGSDSPVFTSKVRGMFPLVAIDTLIHPHWVTLAQAREIEPVPMVAKMGVDVARYGTDKTIILMRQRGHCRVVFEQGYGPTTETAGMVLLLGRGLHDGQVPTAVVDDAGVGGGVTDILEEEGYPNVPFNGGNACTELMKNGKPRFFNLRSQAMWNVREALAGKSNTGEDGWLDLDPNDDDMQAQLTSMKYRVNRFGQIVVETKEEMKARNLSSPDRADALAMSLVPDEGTHRMQGERMITAGILTERW